MEQTSLQKIEKNHGNYASFAIWDEKNYDANPTELIKIYMNDLKPQIVIVGLNASRDTKNFEAFHCKHRGGRGEWLKDAFNKSRFRGAYMTDIIKDVNPKSKNVKLSENDIKTFSNELKDLGCKNFTVIAIGKRAYKILNDNKTRIINQDNIKIDIKKIPHYASRIEREDFIGKVNKLAYSFTKT
ncbi:MAG: hypothetical protein NTU57_05640 [Candidatus Aenigmarchaeota archaeon]|nr:hypothetical protein [Candidatus Aenigmarchaeota archaeon]